MSSRLATCLVIGLLITATPTPVQAQKAEVQCIIGDSQSKGVPGTAPPWWWYLQVDRPGQKFSMVATPSVSGLRCDQLETDSFGANIVSTAGVSYGCTRLYIQCGVNDAMQNRTAEQICGAPGTAGAPGTPGTASTPGPVRRMAARALAAGVPVTIINIGPWGAHGEWNASRQAQTVATNACYATIPGVTVVDAYTLLGMPGSPTLLNTEWDDISGGPDGLHWDTEGARALATGVNNTPGAVLTASGALLFPWDTAHASGPWALTP